MHPPLNQVPDLTNLILKGNLSEYQNKHAWNVNVFKVVFIDVYNYYIFTNNFTIKSKRENVSKRTRQHNVETFLINSLFYDFFFNACYISIAHDEYFKYISSARYVQYIEL